MKIAALLALAVMVVGGALASMNNACKKEPAQLVRPDLKHPTSRQELTGLTALDLGRRAWVAKPDCTSIVHLSPWAVR